jgi:hypothetical protein
MKPVLHSFAYSLDYLREQVADINPADMTAQPPGVLNHPAWVVGHITFACHMLGCAIGVEPWLPPNWLQQFSPGSQPIADVSVYGSKEEALAPLRDVQIRLTQAIEQLDDSQLDKAFPDPEYRSVFPTVRHALTQVLVGHTAYHIGQIGVWRKAMGMPPMKRSYE